MAVNRNLLRTVVTLVGTAAPVVVKYLRDHPEIGQSVQDAVNKLVAKRLNGQAGMLSTVAALRDQVAYLKDSADDEQEALRAQQWSRRLDNLQHAAELLGDGSSRREKKVVRAKVKAIRGEILAAFIAEQADDLQEPPKQLGR